MMKKNGLLHIFALTHTHMENSFSFNFSTISVSLLQNMKVSNGEKKRKKCAHTKAAETDSHVENIRWFTYYAHTIIRREILYMLLWNVNGEHKQRTECA